MGHPLVNADVALRALALGVLESHLPHQPLSVASRVRTIVRQSLSGSTVDTPSVASLLHVHPRTLQRHLGNEGTTLATILDEVRREQALRYLTLTPEVPLGQVASLLGLSAQSTLTRCCRRWWSLTPSQVRQGMVTGS
jgi:AraC-like DNA-binding protein